MGIVYKRMKFDPYLTLRIKLLQMDYRYKTLEKHGNKSPKHHIG